MSFSGRGNHSSDRKYTVPEMEISTEQMVLAAFDETLDEALSHGQSKLNAFREAVTAASMCLSAMDGIEDEESRHQVELLVHDRRVEH